MNHTFADWDTTLLFDGINIKRGCNDDSSTIYLVVDEDGEEDVIILNDTTPYSIEDCVKDNGYIDSRKVISWEDIRLYLKENGYEIFIRRFNSRPKFHDRPYHCEISINNEWDNDFDFWYFTYEEARQDAIKYCLQLIKQS
jgi:hypothetical protein